MANFFKSIFDYSFKKPLEIMFSPWKDIFSGDNVYDTSDSIFEPSDQLDGDFGELQKNNPYLQNTYGDPTLLDKIGHFFGYRTKYDEYMSQQSQNAMNKDFEIRTAAREEDYNSALSMAERERAAGINPELQGISSQSAGAATEMTESPIVNSQAPADDMFQAISFVPNLCSNILSSVISSLRDIREYENLSVDQFSPIDALARLNMDNILGGLSPDELEGYDFLSEIYSSNPFPEKSRLWNIYNDRYRSIAKNHFRNFASSHGQYKSYLLSALGSMESLSYFGGSLNDDGRLVFKDLLSHMADFQDDFLKEFSNRMKARSLQAENDVLYLSEFDSQQQAKTENAVNSSEELQQLILESLREPMNSFVEDLTKMSQSQGFLKSSAGSLSLLTLYGMLLGGKGIGFSSSTHNSDNSGSAFSFHF